MRGEEYSAQLDAWVGRIAGGRPDGVGDFDDAAITDQVLSAILRSDGGALTPIEGADDKPDPELGWWAGLRQRRQDRRARKQAQV